jgi:hypothetical protein
VNGGQRVRRLQDAPALLIRYLRDCLHRRRRLEMRVFVMGGPGFVRKPTV